MDKNQIIGYGPNPYHLSIGLVAHDNGQVALIKMKNGEITLPRKTVFRNVGLEDELDRTAEKELAITVTHKDFLGALITHFTSFDGADVEKSTVYFWGDKSEVLNNEVPEEVMWLSPDEAIAQLSSQDNPESDIIKRFRTKPI